MTIEEMYSYALEILRETNVYNKDIEQLQYGTEHKVVLVKLVKKNIITEIRRNQNRVINEKELLYKAIKNSLIDYYDDFNSSFAVKQRVKEKFCLWLNRIKDECDINDNDIPEEFKFKYSEMDTGIALVKALHNREGLTKKDLQHVLGLKSQNERTIQKSLRKLCPDLYEGKDFDKGYVYSPFRIGGQPIKVDIDCIQKEPKKEKYYRTLNTLHPIVLQENVMQVGTLIQSLARNFFYHNNAVSYTIAIDIWSQLSDYAKQKVEEVYAKKEAKVLEFVEMLKEECPDNHSCIFRTEEEMIYNEDNQLNPRDILEHYEKLGTKRCNVVYEDVSKKVEVLENQRVKLIHYDIENPIYEFISENDKRVQIQCDAIIEITPIK